VQRINQAVRKVMHSPQAQEQLHKGSMETFDWDVPKVNQFFAEEVKRWGPMVAQVQPDK
jgi:tripartite-type tricarboxylate transporter receptor subunit TctC